MHTHTSAQRTRCANHFFFCLFPLNTHCGHVAPPHTDWLCYLPPRPSPPPPPPPPPLPATTQQAEVHEDLARLHQKRKDYRRAEAELRVKTEAPPTDLHPLYRGPLQRRHQRQAGRDLRETLVPSSRRLAPACAFPDPLRFSCCLLAPGRRVPTVRQALLCFVAFLAGCPVPPRVLHRLCLQKVLELAPAGPSADTLCALGLAQVSQGDLEVGLPPVCRLPLQLRVALSFIPSC
jgi:hypothetical protein